jgi:hypothetical protein
MAPVISEVSLLRENEHQTVLELTDSKYIEIEPRKHSVWGVDIGQPAALPLDQKQPSIVT